MQPVFVLVHSPLVGPVTWSLVARELQSRELQAIVPEIVRFEAEPPCWKRHAGEIAQSMMSLPDDTPVVLVGHSGAGPLLPAIRTLIPHNVSAYVFVDAGIPVDGLSRLDLIRLESEQFDSEFRAALEAGAHFPAWSDADLRDVIPDASLRSALVTDLRPQSLAFFDEPIPVFDGWPDAPCGYVHITPAYEVFAARAQAAGWPVATLEGGHFHMLVDPAAVAEAILIVSSFR